MHLLLAAYQIQFYLFNDFLVLKVRHRGIVERDVSVLTDAHKRHMGGSIAQQLAVAGRFLFHRAGPIDQIRALERDLVENGFAEEMIKGFFVAQRQSHILVHVITVHPGPVDAGLFAQLFQELRLRGSSRKNAVDLRLFLQKLPQAGSGFLGCHTAHFGARIKNFQIHFVILFFNQSDYLLNLLYTFLTDRRSTSVGSITTFSWAHPGCSMASSSIRAAFRPISCDGWLMVVSAGSTKSLI